MRECARRTTRSATIAYAVIRDHVASVARLADALLDKLSRSPLPNNDVDRQ